MSLEKRPIIKVKLDAGASLPAKAHEWRNGVPGDAGYDVKVLSVETERINPAPSCRTGWVRVKLDTGVHIQPPAGYRIMAVPNSRVTKTGFVMPNSPGTIDANYRGSIRFIYLYPFDRERNIVEVAPQYPAGLVPQTSTFSVVYKDDYEAAAKYSRSFWKPGTVCGQLILVPDYDSGLQVCTELDETSRGEGGFGSSVAPSTENDARLMDNGLHAEAAPDNKLALENGQKA